MRSSDVLATRSLNPMRTIPLVAVLALFLIGCSEPPPDPAQRDSAQQRQHDSMIGASGLPGASGVHGALRAADSAAARRLREAATTDSS
ncbi:MAG TPA: hypothetical protein VFN22_10035 [Gemmatimonadales bacterium]|nr:hypothetical protein [Gemmatimonadales bacterium]